MKIMLTNKENQWFKVGNAISAEITILLTEKVEFHVEKCNYLIHLFEFNTSCYVFPDFSRIKCVGNTRTWGC